MKMSKRCEQCEMIPLVRIHNPNEYIMCIESFNRMIVKGEMELVYATCPLDQIIDEQGRFYTLTDDFTDGHRYLITELIYDSKTGQFKKGKVTDKDWAY